MSTYAISDLHGRLDLYQEVKKFLKPEDKVYCLGDCGDRGPDGWETIKAVYNDPQFEYLMGNHEHMLLYAMIQVKTGRRLKYDNPMELVFYNGGRETFDAWHRENVNFDWIDKLYSLQGCVSYVNESGIQVILSHAGFTPDPNDTREIPLFKLIWNREHFNDKWPQEFNNVLMVHGHTPVQYMTETKNTDVIWYGQGHKVNIDIGAYAFNKTVLFDLDTFDEHYFEVIPKEKDIHI